MADTIKLFCPDCDQKLEIEIIPGVRSVNCPICGGKIIIPIIDKEEKREPKVTPIPDPDREKDIDFEHLHKVFANENVRQPSGMEKHLDFQKFSPEPEPQKKPERKRSSSQEKKSTKPKRQAPKKKKNSFSRKPMFTQPKGPFDKYVRPVIAALVVGIILFAGYKFAMNEINKEKAFREQVAREREAAMRLRELQREKEKRKSKDAWAAILRQVRPSKLKTEQDFDDAVSLVKNFKGGDANKKVTLLTQIKKYKRLRIAHILKELQLEAESLAAEKKYSEAVSLYQDYSGDFAEETAGERNKRVAEYLEKLDVMKEQKNVAAAKLEDKKILFLGEICNSLLSDNINGALASLKNSEFSAELADLKKDLDDIKNIKKIVIDSFRKQIGRRISFEAMNKKHSLTLKKVSFDGLMEFESKSGTVELTKKFVFSDLGEPEKITRLSKINKRAAAIYAAVKATEIRKFNDAERFTSQMGQLAIPFKSVLDNMKNGTFVKQKQTKKIGFVSEKINFKKIKCDVKVSRISSKLENKAESYVEKIKLKASIKNFNKVPLDNVYLKIFVIASSLKKKHILKVIQSFSKKLFVKENGFYSKELSFKNTYSNEIELDVQGGSFGMNNANGYKYYSWLLVICDSKGEVYKAESKYKKFKLNPEKIMASKGKDFRDF
jgi:DNA-directed RNA polymerase subunit RPC12/RpoP